MNDVKNLITVFEFRMENLKTQLKNAENDRYTDDASEENIVYIKGKIAELDMVLSTMRLTLTK